MNKTLFYRTLIRTPLKTLVIFLLLSVSMFGIVLQLIEMEKTSSSINQAKDEYFGVGYAEVEPYKGHGVSDPLYLDTDPRMNVEQRFADTDF